MYKNYEHKGHYYINFYFENIEYDEKTYSAHFRAPDYDTECDFVYDRETDEILVMHNNKSVEDILPIPVYWLEKRLKENGSLRDHESKRSI